MMFAIERIYQTKTKGWLALLLAGVLLWGSVVSAAELQQVEVNHLSAEVVEIKLLLSEVPSNYRHFATDKPARIIVDLANTSLALKRKRRELTLGKLTGLRMVESAGRSRVIVNLTASSPYDLSQQGQSLILRIGKKEDIHAASNRVKASATNIAAAMNTLEKVDFRRGPKGEGRIILDFNNANIASDVHEESGQLVVELLNARLPKSLERRLDVVDFATVVRSIDS
ncbi:MAG: AMIN domain-containing protein, partial [Gammaproteobacteria bacterium]|nr:AMIN domain-containing protein [Gammaproteobacteria bacterium]